MSSSSIERFEQLSLAPPILQTLEEIGYETPSPIQAASIPHLLAGRDLIGQAQTGTGKTAAFALPLLNKLDLGAKVPQVLVLTPTRELAIQVAEAFQTYARHLHGFHVLPIYGGQNMGTQLHQLKRGVHVVIGTPGRIMDHLRRGSLSLDGLKAVVLDEADEMLRMGFIEDVEWILEHTPAQRQVALFSATMPEAIRKVANRYLRDPAEVRIKTTTATVSAIQQRYWQVSGVHKLDALTRILEMEDSDAILIFVRTKTATVELAEKLEARGYACAALNGDMSQVIRERTIEQLKNKTLDIVVATDVAARGLDVQRLSHVINYDIPYDTEAYVHRIGRTGRAGRSGNAILFVSPREVRMLRAIEKATRQPIERMQLPSKEAISDRRIAQFKEWILNVVDGEDLDFFHGLVHDLQKEHDIDSNQIAAALAFLVQRERPLQLKKEAFAGGRGDKSTQPDSAPTRLGGKIVPETDQQTSPAEIDPIPLPLKDFPEIEMVRYRLACGRNQGVSPKDIVGAIANEAGIESCYIGHIKLYDECSTVDLPEGMPKEILQHLRRVRVRQFPLEFTPLRLSAARRGEAGEKKKWAKGKKEKAGVKRSKKKTR